MKMLVDSTKRVLRAIGIRRPLAPEQTNPAKRHALSKLYLRGRRIEIGALHRPLPVRMGTGVSYVDRYDRENLRKEYPELRSYNLVKLDITDNGGTGEIIGLQYGVLVSKYDIDPCVTKMTAIAMGRLKLRPGELKKRAQKFDVSRVKYQWLQILESVAKS